MDTNIQRPEWCPDITCEPLDNFDRLCCGRLKQAQSHNMDGLELKNTHSFCLLADPAEGDDLSPQRVVNIADCYYFCTLLICIMKDVINNGMYNPCEQLAIVHPITNLINRLKEI
jgi:hypothetical protein